MKVSLLVLSALATSVSAQGKKGGSPSPTGGKKGMSMVVEEPAGAEFCNSGRTRCGDGEFPSGCSDFEGKSMNGLLDTDACIAFCAANMESEDYLIQWRPANNAASNNRCQCFTACLGYADISRNAGDNAVLFAVGDKECSAFNTPDRPCDAPGFGLCRGGMDNRCMRPPARPEDGPFGPIPTTGDCANECFSRGLPLFVYNDQGDCACYANSAACGGRVPIDGASILSVVESNGANECPQGLVPTAP